MKEPERFEAFDALDTLQGRQVQPLVVLGIDVGMGQQGGALHVPRLIKHEQALVPVARHLQHLEAHLADALATVSIAQHHRHAGGESPKPSLRPRPPARS